MFTIVWIDRAQAQIVHFSHDRMERRYLSGQAEDLFSRAVPELVGSTRMILTGPCVAKYNFQSFLREHYPAISRRILATEALLEASDGELAKMARRHLERLPA